MQQRDRILKNAPVYVTANSLMREDISLEFSLQATKDAGADGFEVRRELLPQDMQADYVRELYSQLADFRLPPIYSTPQALFSNKGIREDVLEQTLREAFSLGCTLVKFAPGSMNFGGREATATFSTIQNTFPDLTITIENDRHPEHSKITDWLRFFEQVTAWNCPLWMTFDMGNWLCNGSDLITAARELAPYVIYIHAKAVVQKDGNCSSEPLRPASTQHASLAYLPGDVPRAIEFPIVESRSNSLVETLREYIAWLRSGNFSI
jgi:sugar phosphate isomerase/epimerase